MNPHSPTPSSRRRRVEGKPAPHRGRAPTLSERHTEAYLLARDAVRRIQRTSSLVDVISLRAGTGGQGTPGDRLQRR